MASRSTMPIFAAQNGRRCAMLSCSAVVGGASDAEGAGLWMCTTALMRASTANDYGTSSTYAGIATRFSMVSGADGGEFISGSLSY